MLDTQTIQFLAFALFCLFSLVGGYLAHHRGGLDERYSRIIHVHTVTWLWSAGTLISMWNLRIEWQTLWLAPMLVLLIGVSMWLMARVVRWLHLPRKQAGVVVLAAGLSNLGFTLGASLVYLLAEHQVLALGYAGVLMSVFNVAMILIGFPVARYYGSEPGEGETVLRLMRESLTERTALPIYAALTGLLLAIMEVPFPSMLQSYGMIDVLIFLSGLGGYFGLGMRIRLRGGLQYWRAHAALAAFKFGVSPVLAAAMITLVGMSGLPLHSVAAEVFQIDAMMPAAVAAVILPNIFHLDAKFGGVLWLWNTSIFFLLVLIPLLLFVS